ncbi:iron complex outermembrane receptor protein [Collimonas sp. PA-H2]|uniref:TonB-dependent copper receptor n=1 Tax=Collimonas sp. PA-H2 TaxID=1881062 RepID=UPI000C01C3DA|nr:TonB-dependent copper receptor [Collimonas sp. PA-H2]PFH04379.1 iron complex outermembrane receptor protein [Collimonas sp. PA-H2]
MPHVPNARPKFLPTLIHAAIVSSSALTAGAIASDVATNEVVLPTVVITAAQETSPLTIVVDPKAPRQPIPASDGADFLKTIPGFSAVRNGGSNGDPVLRGMFGSRINILNDGTTILGACPGRMDAPTSYISPESFDKLTVIKGPQSVIWGPGASAGTVLFERQTERFSETENPVRFDGGLTAGSYGRNEQRADLTAGTPDIYTRVIANHAKANDYKDGNKQTVASRWDKWNLDAALGFTPDANTMLELNAGAGDGSAAYAGRGMDGVSFKRHSFNAKFEKRNVSQHVGKIEAMAYYNYADHLMDNYTLRKPDPNAGMMKMPMASEVDRRTVGARIAATLQWDDALSLVTGFDMQQNAHRARNGMGIGSYAQKPWNKDAAFSNVGMFGEVTWSVAPRQRLISGVRIDYATVKDERGTLGQGMAAAPNPTADMERRVTLPSGFARYEYDLPSKAGTLYAGLGHAERFPDYWELFSPKMAPAGSPNAFAGIRPEKTTQLDIGAQYKAGAWQAWASAYLGVVNDYILFSYLPGAMGATSQANNIDAQIMGGELGASYGFAPHWKIDSSLAYAWGRNRSDGKALPQMPPLDTRLTMSYNDERWSFGALWRLVSAQNRVALNEGNVVGKDFGRSAGFGVLSMNAAYAFSKSLQIVAGIDNVFNKAYAEHLNLAGNTGFGYAANSAINDQGRTAWVKLGVKY